MHHLHWLLPGEYKNEVNIFASELASIRMRAGLVKRHAASIGLNMTAGDAIHPLANILMVGKIGGDCALGRSENWLVQMEHAKSRGVKIILDYTDHHLANPQTAMGIFYKKSLPFIDEAVVPSRKMKSLLSSFFPNNIEVIQDPLEVEVKPTRLLKENEKPVVLWFGHASNISYLINYLENHELCDASFNLIVLSNKNGLSLFSSKPLKTKSTIGVKMALWSISAMQSAAGISHACIIPSDAADIKKAGASSNRLITALAMGLPTLAEGLSAYNEFESYFDLIREVKISNFFKTIIHNNDKVSKAQQTVIPDFMSENLCKKWKHILTCNSR